MDRASTVRRLVYYNTVLSRLNRGNQIRKGTIQTTQYAYFIHDPLFIFVPNNFYCNVHQFWMFTIKKKGSILSSILYQVFVEYLNVAYFTTDRLFNGRSGEIIIKCNVCYVTALKKKKEIIRFYNSLQSDRADQPYLIHSLGRHEQT